MNKRLNISQLDKHNTLIQLTMPCNVKQLTHNLRLPHHASRLIIDARLVGGAIVQVLTQAGQINWSSYQPAQLDDLMLNEINQVERKAG